MTISQRTANSALQCIRKLATEYSTTADTISTSAYILAKLIDNDILPTDNTPTSLGVLLFGDEFIANETPDNWQVTFINAIVSCLPTDDEA